MTPMAGDLEYKKGTWRLHSGTEFKTSSHQHTKKHHQSNHEDTIVLLYQLDSSSSNNRLLKKLSYLAQSAINTIS